MALRYKTRKRLSLIMLCIGLPAYIVLVVSLMNYVGRLPFLLEIIAYVIAGCVWVFPFKNLFRGIGQADPDE